MNSLDSKIVGKLYSSLMHLKNAEETARLETYKDEFAGIISAIDALITKIEGGIHQ